MIGKKMDSEIRAGRYFGREDSKERTFSEFIDIYIEKSFQRILKLTTSRKCTSYGGRRLERSYYVL